MSYDARQQSACGSAPYEGYWFTCGPLSWCYVSGSVERTIHGMAFEPEVISRTEPEQNQEPRSGSIEVTLPLDNPVARMFLAGPTPRPVGLVVYGCEEGESEVVVVFSGTVSSPKATSVMTLTMVAEQDAMKRKVPGVHYQLTCPRAIFSPGCGLRKVDFETLATLAGVGTKSLRSSAFAARPDGYFNGGWVEANGQAFSVDTHTGDTLHLFLPVLGRLKAGDVVATYPGCQGTEAVCGALGNLVNHLGFSRIPKTNPFGSGGIQ